MKYSHRQVVLLALASLCCSAHVLQEWNRGELVNVYERSAPDGGHPSTRSSAPLQNCKDSRGGNHKDGELCLMAAFGNTAHKPFRCMVGICSGGKCVLQYFSNCSTS
ncbi:hypothetical protein MTO96_043999 [Rhipicephalus appendiculatus]